MKLDYFPMILRYRWERFRYAIVRESYKLGLGFIILLAVALVWALIPSKPKEVALYIGQHFDEIQKNSTYPLNRELAIPSDFPSFGTTTITEPVALRFTDSQYGFLLPPTKLLAVTYSKGRASTVQSSPQLETLPLEEALALAELIRAQLRKSGWVLDHEFFHEDVYPEIYERISRYPGGAKGHAPSGFWHAGDKYDLYFYLQAFIDPDGKWNGKYLITLSISTRSPE